MPACPPARAGMRFLRKLGKRGLTNAVMRGIIYLAFAGVAHLVERDLAKVEVASSSLVARSKKKHHPSGWCFLFGMPRAGWNSLPRPARSAANRSVGDGVPDVPSARRCRAGNGFPRRFAPRSKCPWGAPRNDRGGVYRHAATIRQDGVSFLTVPGETPVSGRAAPPAPRRSAPAGRPGRR